MGVDREYLRDQYSGPEKLQIRIQTHREFTDVPDTWIPDLIDELRLSPSLGMLDVGCGFGGMHADFLEHDVRLTGIDQSIGLLREARRNNGGQVRYAQADAQGLPFDSAAFDRLLAGHMLFFVRDREQALNEMRRVVRPGGRVVLTTNGPNTMQPLTAVHETAARALGFEPTSETSEWFTLAHLPLEQSVFPDATVHEFRNALVFPTAEPALRFYATGRIDRIKDAPRDGSHRARLLPLVREQIEARIAADGAFRVPKTTGFFVAQV